MSCDGYSNINIKTINGSIKFKLQRFIDKNGKNSSNYFKLTGQFENSYKTNEFIKLLTKYATECSYKVVEEIAKDVTGCYQISDQGIQNIIIKEGLKISKDMESEYLLSKDKEMPKLNEEFDIYDSTIEEKILQMDGVLTKEQKGKRDKVKRLKKKFLSNDIVAIQNKDGFYEYLISSINENGDISVKLEEHLKSKIKSEYGKEEKPLNIVVISDGASNIRSTLQKAFGFNPTIILDWFHLSKRVSEFMSMIAKSKEEKRITMKFIKNKLWNGEVEEVIDYIEDISSKNIRKNIEFMEYLDKHKKEIINYDKRKKAKKTIGSGFIEKTVDQIVAARQKKKGMSWSILGSRCLALLKMKKLTQKNEVKYGTC